MLDSSMKTSLIRDSPAKKIENCEVLSLNDKTSFNIIPITSSKILISEDVPSLGSDSLSSPLQFVSPNSNVQDPISPNSAQANLQDEVDTSIVSSRKRKSYSAMTHSTPKFSKSMHEPSSSKSSNIVPNLDTPKSSRTSKHLNDANFNDSMTSSRESTSKEVVQNLAASEIQDSLKKSSHKKNQRRKKRIVFK